MTDNRRQVLDMLAEGKISVDEAERLLSLVEQQSAGEPGRPDPADSRKPPPKYLRIVVGNDSDSQPERVNIRVPMGLIRAGVKLAALLPSEAAAKVNEKLKSKGLDFDLLNFKADDLEELVGALADLEVDVQGGHEKVRVYVE